MTASLTCFDSVEGADIDVVANVLSTKTETGSI